MKYLVIGILVVLAAGMFRSFVISPGRKQGRSLRHVVKAHSQKIHSTVGILAALLVGLLIVRLVLMAFRVW